ncbi:S-layer homology domain-containing protein [Paenibacillus aestuarii]|uniref:S-layer homology domain-containing protein n=1 Tax=Paenibacillus aestuarii TaxID=516965 RepID=A0ABW0K2L6_9BACL|nr:S-layer homology domain-containing protein [Paenibacillus aestuarii]
MTMKRKAAITTLAASMMLSTFAGLPLSQGGLLSKLGVANVALATPADSSSLLNQLIGLRSELERDTDGITAVQDVAAYVQSNMSALPTDKQRELTNEIWSKVNAKAPGLDYSAVFQLINSFDLFFNGSADEISAIIDNPDYRAALDELFVSVGLPGIDEPAGLKKSDVISFQQAVLQALRNNKSEIVSAMSAAFAGGTVDKEAIINQINTIVTRDVLSQNLLISQLLNKYGITLGDLNVVQNRIAGYIEAQTGGEVKAKNARTAIESAAVRYLLNGNIQYAKDSTSTAFAEKPTLTVLGVKVPAGFLSWSAASNSGISFNGTAFVLTGSTAATAQVKARDTKFGLLLYISKVDVSLTPDTGGNSGGGGNNGGGGNSGGSTPAPAGGGGGAPSTPTSPAQQAMEELNKLKDQLAGASEEKKQEIFKQAQAQAEQAIKSLATLDLKSLIKVENGTAKPTLNVTDLVNKLKDIAAQAKALNDQLKALNPDAKEVKLQLTLDFGTIDAKSTEIPLPKDLISAAIANGVGTIAIAMNGLTLGVSPSEFNADTTLKVTKQDATVATSVTQLPVASGVYEFEFDSNGSKVDSFNTPVTVSIPVPNGSQFDTELLTLAKIVDGKLEFYGGNYANGTLNGKRSSFSTYTVVENKVSFNDTASVKAWAGRQIQVAAAKGILEGRGEQTFDPNGLVTRAEFAKMIVKTFSLENAKATENFDDVADADWFKVYVASAVKSGIVNGKEAGKFDPNGQITRAEMAVMASRALALKGITLNADKANEALKGFVDADTINDSLKNGVALAASEGIIVGEDGNAFNPNANSTRAQAAVVIYRLLNK